MLTHQELRKKMLGNPNVKAEFDALKAEFSFFDELLKARCKQGLPKPKWPAAWEPKHRRLPDWRQEGEIKGIHLQYQHFKNTHMLLAAIWKSSLFRPNSRYRLMPPSKPIRI